MKYIMGVGNYSMYDDSIGIRVVEYISEQGLEDGFQAIDLSGNALNIFSYLTEETTKMVIVDTATLGLAPGEFQFFLPREVKSTKELSGFTSHEGDMVKVLELARQTGYPIPEIIFLGIEAADIHDEFGLSSVLSENFNRYVEAAIDKIQS